MENVRVKTMIIMNTVILATTVLLWFFNGLGYQRNPAMLIEGLGIYIAIVIVLCSSGSIYTWVRMKPLEDLIKRINQGHNPSGDERHAALNIIRAIPVILLFIHGAGFFVGPIASIVARAAMGRTDLFQLDTIIVVLYSVAMGTIAALIEIQLINNVMIKPREAFKVYTISDSEKIRSSTRTDLLITAACSALAVALFLGFSIGALRQALELPLNLSRLTADEAGAISAIFSSGTSPGSEATAAFKSFVSGRLVRFFIEGILLTLLVAASVVLLVKASSRFRASQIRVLSDHITATLSGKAGLDTRTPILNRDEIGLITDRTNRLMDKLTGMIADSVATAKKISQGAEKLDSAAGEVATAVARSEASLQRVQENTDRQNAISSETDTALEDLIGTIEQVREHVHHQGASVEQTSAAIVEISANIDGVAKAADSANLTSKNLLTKSTQGGKSVQDLKVAMEAINEASRKVADFVKVIAKISAQTNLLAMNATIEAAHAGDYGRGFAIVADEVRRLAADSSESAKRITTQIKDMKNRISNGLEVTGTAISIFKEIEENVRSTTDQVSAIASAMEEQKSGASEIGQAMESLVESTAVIKELSEVQFGKSTSMRKAGKDILSASQETAQAVKEQVRLNEELSGIIETLKVVSEENLKALDTLRKAGALQA